MTVREAQSWAVRQLSQARVDSPRLTSELLLGYVLGWTRVRILTYPEQPVETEQEQRFRSLIRRRASGEPLQYLVGEQEFHGLSFRVTPAVLIPRPETELLVEEAIACAKDLPDVRIADIGTGSGCIAVSIAVVLPEARLWATDVSTEALAIARENAIRWKVQDRITFVAGDLLSCFAESMRFDLVLSNPPYISLSEFDSVSPLVREHEPAAALFGGPTGREIYSRLAPESVRHLNPGGCLLLEVGAGQAEQVSKILRSEGLAVERIAQDLQGVSRCIIARKEARENQWIR